MLIDRYLPAFDVTEVHEIEVAHTHFRRHWRLLHPGVAIVMRRALTRIRDEAERRAAVTRAAAS